MLTDNFYKDILISPAQRGATLYVVSGYATAAMALRHMCDLLLKDANNVCIKLIVGMTAKDGISESNHKGFCKLVEAPPIEKFQCAYIPEGQTPVHTKAYAWFNDEQPVHGYVGSANYTQTGFFQGQSEAMEETDPLKILEYYGAVEGASLLCNHPEVQGLIKDDKTSRIRHPDLDDVRTPPLEEPVQYTLLDRQGQLPSRSGLNWGQRPQENREPNQAYIRVPADIRRLNFFPPRGHHFMLHTDDGQMILCCIRQDDGKAIHSTQNNSAIGIYFRNRLGVPLGQVIKKRHLVDYGRTDITFHKVDDENYFMDFSV